MTDGLTKDVAQERARHATAVTSPRGVFVRADRFAAIPFAERVGVIAHELAHVSQQFMRTGGPGAAAQWIREGHAEWVKYRVLDDLDIRRYGESRDGVLRAVVGGSTPVSRFPSLFGLARNEGWADALKRFGWSATYGQAFLAVDWLVERWGIERLHEFLGRFARPEDPRQHWHAVYGSGGALFIEEFRHRLETAR
jgi:hypothetical protein